MRARHPTIWLITDERLASELWRALRRLPPSAGVVFRHHATPEPERTRLFCKVRRVAAARRLIVISAHGRLPGAAGVHGPGRGGGLRTWPAHDRRQAITAKRAGAALVFVSPVYPTRSHPGATALGPMRAARLGQSLGLKLIALGGMDARRWLRIRQFGFDGWAGIDAWSTCPDKPKHTAAKPRRRS